MDGEVPQPNKETKAASRKRRARPPDHFYALQHLTLAAHQLCTGVGPIKERLFLAYEELAGVSEREIPQPLRRKWSQLVTRLTRNEPKVIKVMVDGRLKDGLSTRAQATIPYLRIATAVHLAGVIAGLECELRERLYSRPVKQERSRHNRANSTGDA